MYPEPDKKRSRLPSCQLATIILATASSCSRSFDDGKCINTTDRAYSLYTEFNVLSHGCTTVVPLFRGKLEYHSICKIKLRGARGRRGSDDSSGTTNAHGGAVCEDNMRLFDTPTHLRAHVSRAYAAGLKIPGGTH